MVEAYDDRLGLERALDGERSEGEEIVGGANRVDVGSGGIVRFESIEESKGVRVLAELFVWRVVHDHSSAVVRGAVEAIAHHDRQGVSQRVRHA